MNNIDKHFTPFSDDIVFFDAEMTQLDVEKGELMAIGMINYDGSKELYLELEYDKSTLSEWTKEHVVPYLNSSSKISKTLARQKIKELCGHSEPHLVATVNQWDMTFWHKLFAGEETPVNRIPIDFASILYAIGLNPTRTIDDKKSEFYKQFGIDISDYNLHNALDDTRLMRDLYFKLAKKVFIK